MKNVERLLLSLILLILFLPLFVGLGIGSWGTLTYEGSEHFDMIDEAVDYQKYIMEVADDNDASYVSVEISRSSPPVVSYRITLKPSEHNKAMLLPEGKRLDGGTQHIGVTGFWINFIIVSLFALFLMSLMWWRFWIETPRAESKE